MVDLPPTRQIRLKDIAIGLQVQHRQTKQISTIVQIYRADKLVGVRASSLVPPTRITFDDLTRRFRHV